MSEQVRVPLGEVIRALRREIVEASRVGQDEEVRFKLGPIELEFAVQVSREAVGEAGLKFWVISLGGQAKRGTSDTQKVKLVLTPATASGDVLVLDKTETRPK